MLPFLEKAVLGMAALRLLSGSVEILAALIMLKLNQVEKALVVNSVLSFIGPLVLISTTAVGLVGIADRISFGKLLWIALGVLCILIGVRK
ncbi:YqhV family protein [Bacillaceae bacterium]